MAKYNQIINLQFSCQQLYDLVMDIESYPEFLPWCKNAKILSKNDDQVQAELTINFQTFNEKYISLVRFDKNKEINVSQSHGPFKYLHNKWQFIEQDNEMAQLIFSIDFEFKSLILNNLANIFIKPAAQKITNAFINRSKFLYL